MPAAAPPADPPSERPESLARDVRSAVLWRSGSQIVAQAVQWGATFLVLRILAPADYGLVAMTGTVLAFLNMLNGYGLASSLVCEHDASDRAVAQVFGMLILANAALAALQVALAPAVAAFYGQPLVADLLRVQAIAYAFTPFIALPAALLTRAMDFRRQAQVNLAAALAGALTALGGALAGWGVWTLVAAPLALFGARALGMTIAARRLVRPTFDFRGAGRIARFGGALAAGQLFWFAQSQADVLIGGRVLGAHDLGLYTTALFLAQIFVSKVVPPLNEVAFSAYARLRDDAAATAWSFLKSVRIIMAAALPFYLGLAIVAEPLVLTMLGQKWAGVAPVVRLIALAMPFMTVQVLFTPACDALGRPGIGVRNGATGAALLAVAFLIGVNWGPVGLAAGWLVAYPIYLLTSCRRSLPVIGVRGGELWAAVVPSLAPSAGMAAAVLALDLSLPPLAMPLRLAILVAAGGAVYAALLLALSRPLVTELRALARR